MNKMLRDIKSFIAEQGGRVLAEEHLPKRSYHKLTITNGVHTGTVKVPVNHGHARAELIARGTVKQVLTGRAIDLNRARH